MARSVGAMPGRSGGMDLRSANRVFPLILRYS